MGKYEVTQAQYEKIMGAKFSRFKGADMPVQYVSWDDAQAFCKKASELTKKAVKLPTEAQWEYACRAGTTTEYYTGQDIQVDGDAGLSGALVKVAGVLQKAGFSAAMGEAGWYDHNSGYKPNPVGKKVPNAWGLYDMHGNMSEWCEDWFGDYEAGPVSDPQGPASGAGRVTRGGCFGGSPWHCRSAARSGVASDSANGMNGFRICVPAAEPSVPRQIAPPARPAESAAAHWDRAIAEAEAGQDVAALESFQHAIEMDSDYYVSAIQPASARANACWKRAVDRFVSRKDAQAKAGQEKPGQPAENHCACCGKDVGTQWHYGFESIAMESTLAAQCPDCGRIVCKDDLKYGPDGNYPPCPNCGAKIQEMSEGPAYSSMVDKARSERRYRGAIKEPSNMGRPVIRE